MKTAILVDSASDIDETFAASKNIFFIKFHAFLDGKDYILNKNISREEYAALVKSSKSYPKTAVPSVEEVQEVISNLRVQGFSRFVFIVSSKKISGIYKLCKNLIEKDGALKNNSLLFDSGSTSAELGILPLILVQHNVEELSLDQIERLLQKLSKNSKFYYSVYDLSYLVKGGRLKPIPGFFGKLLNIFPLGSQEEGVPVVVGKAIGIKNTMSKFVDFVSDFTKKDGFYYGILSGSTESEEFAEQLKGLLKRKFGQRAEFIYHFRTNLVPTSHFGPDVFGVVVVRK